MRPQPGADETAARAAALGLETLVAPIFEVRPVAWEAPPAGAFDALLLTSANAARHGGPALARYRALPCYCVGEATEAAAREAGLVGTRAGPSDGAAVLAAAAADGVLSMLHLTGLTHKKVAHPNVRIERRLVYETVPLGLSTAAVAAIREACSAFRGNDDEGECGLVVLLHSAAAARHFGELVDAARLPRARIGVAAISDAAAREAGEGWRAVHVAPAPRDAALLALAAELCQTGGSAAGTGCG